METKILRAKGPGVPVIHDRVPEGVNGYVLLRVPGGIVRAWVSEGEVVWCSRVLGGVRVHGGRVLT